VQQSNRTAAAQSASGASSQAPATWRSALMAHLERRKRYPPGAQSRGERGIVYVRFTIDASGNVQSVSLSRSSGHPELDQEVLALVRRASPVPAPPPGTAREIVAPVRFSGG
jgi:protein TonB